MAKKTWDQIIDEADRVAKEEFISDASSLVKLTNEEIEAIIPPEVDHKHFAELIAVVHDAQKSNMEKAEAIRNSVEFAKIAVNLVAKFI